MRRNRETCSPRIRLAWPGACSPSNLQVQPRKARASYRRGESCQPREPRPKPAETAVIPGSTMPNDAVRRRAAAVVSAARGYSPRSVAITPKWSLGKVPSTGASKQTRASSGWPRRALVAAVDEDVVDAAVGLAERRRERVAPRVGDPAEPSPADARRRPGSRRAGPRRATSGPRRKRISSESGSALKSPTRMAGKGLGRRGGERLDPERDVADLRLADVPLLELPVEVRHEEREAPEGRLDRRVRGACAARAVPARGSSNVSALRRSASARAPRCRSHRSSCARA